MTRLSMGEKKEVQGQPHDVCRQRRGHTANVQGHPSIPYLYLVQTLVLLSTAVESISVLQGLDTLAV